MTTGRSRTAIAILALALGTLMALAAPAAAEFDIDSFDGSILDTGGVTYTQAGGRPDTVTTTFIFTKTTNAAGKAAPSGAVKDILIDLPPGLIGNPIAVPRCRQTDFAAGLAGNCPKASQVGTTQLLFNYNEGTGALSGALRPVYSLVPPPGVAALFGFRFLTATVTIAAQVRTGGDYGVTLSLHETSQVLGLFGATTTFWGVPASHNEGLWTPTPFITMPTSCLGPQTTTLHVNSWQEPEIFKVKSFVSHDTVSNPVGNTGCDLLSFDPSMTVSPDTAAADSPTGLEIELSVPQGEDVDVPAQSQLKDAVVTLPEGVTLNPSSADGLASCTPSQADLDGKGPVACPDASKIGTVEIKSPLLEDPLTGGIFLATPHQNPFDSLVAIYVSAMDPPSGTAIKLPGRVDLDPESGRLTTTFEDNPQLPFETFKLHFFGGPKASLKTPPRCGSYAATGTYTPWSGMPPTGSTGSFDITSGPAGGPCPDGAFDPQFEAGTVNPVAGRHSPLVLRFSRPDGSSGLSTLTAKLPAGLLGRLAGIPYCPDATLAGIPTATGTGSSELASPSCPAASRLGTVTIGAGAGPDPLHVDTGRAYLAGPYKGAPFSIAFVTPVVAGPFDLGNAVVRAALEVDPRTVQITAVSDPLPRILHGIPLDIRDVRVNLDGDRFILNPTSCEPSQIGATITSVTGTEAFPASRFQVGDCASLPFQPKFDLQLRGGTHRGNYQRLRATVTYPKGGAYANIARAAVTLPHAAFLAQSHIRTVCTRVQWAQDACPGGSIYGRAHATSPLVDYPLSGPVYLRSSDNTLPDVVAKLRGPDSQPIEIELAGRTDSVRGALRNTFDVVPDAPVERFTLELFGGKRALVELSTDDYCVSKHRATVNLRGQNGRRRVLRPVVRNPKCAKRHRKRGRGHRGR